MSKKEERFFEKFNKITCYAVKTTTRIQHSLEGPDKMHFNERLSENIQKAQYEPGLDDMIKYLTSVYEQFYGPLQPRTRKDTAAEVKTPTEKIAGIYSRNLLRNTIKILSIKRRQAPEEKLEYPRKDFYQELTAALARASRSTTDSTVISYTLLESCNMCLELLHDCIEVEAQKADPRIRCTLSIHTDCLHDSHAMSAYYKEQMQVVTCTVPVIKLTCRIAKNVI